MDDNGRTRNILIKTAYDGTNYIGWQRQPEYRGISVQQVIEDALSKVLSQTVCLHGSGRTDAGVHAQGQYANFVCQSPIPIEKLLYAAGNILPADIALISAHDVPMDFSARFSAFSKTYRYVMTDQRPSVFASRYVWRRPRPLSAESMREAAAALIGEHDFSSFTVNSRTLRNSMIRTVYSARVFTLPELLYDEKMFFPWQSFPAAIAIEITANGFLYKMMRLIASCLSEIGMGKIKADQMTDLLSGKARFHVPPAPPGGLVLAEVDYGEKAAVLLEGAKSEQNFVDTASG